LREDEAETEMSIRRICLLHAIILSIGGVPLLYLGDEVGTLNDYTYRDDSAKYDDSRWVHRPDTDWAQMENRHDEETIEGRVFTALARLIQLRKSTPGFRGNQMEMVDVRNDHVLAFIRTDPNATREMDQSPQRIMVLANFTERPQPVSANEFRLHGFGNRPHNLITDAPLDLSEADVQLEPYQVVWAMEGHF